MFQEHSCYAVVAGFVLCALSPLSRFVAASDVFRLFSRTGRSATTIFVLALVGIAMGMVTSTNATEPAYVRAEGVVYDPYNINYPNPVVSFDQQKQAAVGATSFADEASGSCSYGGILVSADASQTSTTPSISAIGTTTFSSTASVSASMIIQSTYAESGGALASSVFGNSSPNYLGRRFVLPSRSDLVLSGTVDLSGIGGIQAFVALDAPNTAWWANTTYEGPPPSSFSYSGTVPAGYFTLAAEAHAQVPFGQYYEPAVQYGSASYQFTLSISPAPNVTWVSPTTGDFNASNNWQDDGHYQCTPTYGDHLKFSLPNNYAVNFSQYVLQHVASVNVQAGNVTWNLNSGSIEVFGSSDVTGSGTSLSVIGGAFSIYDSFTVGQCASLSVQSAGMRILGSFTVGQGASLYIQNDSGIDASGQVSVNGTLTISDSSYLVASVPSGGGGGGVAGVFLASGPTGTNSINAPNVATIAQGSSLSGAGTVVVGSSGSVALASGPTGTSSINAPNGMMITQGGSLSGGGTVVVGSGSAGLQNSGNVSPAVSSRTQSDFPGVLAVQGDYTQTSNGVFHAQIASTTNYSQMTVTGITQLDGALNVTTPGSATTPGFLPYNGTYNVLAASNLSTGSFNSNAKVVQTQFASDNATSGVFHVEYGTNGVILSGFHQIHVLSYGVTFADGSRAGGVDATKVSAAFANVAGVVDNTPVPRASTQSGNSGALLDSITAMANQVHAGDTSVFFIGSHGTFDPLQWGLEGPTLRQTGYLKDNNGVEYITSETTQSPSELYLSDAGGVVSGAQLAGAFTSPNWVGVNKLFIVDACYAGGLWSGPSPSGSGSVQYLSALDHSAIIAAAPEEKFAWSRQVDGQGLLALALEQTLNNLGNSELDFSGLYSQINGQIRDELVYYQNGMIEDPQTLWGGTHTTANNLWGQATSDFTLVLGGNSVAVPEPATSTLLLVGILVAVSLQRLRCRRRPVSCAHEAPYIQGCH